MAKLIIFGIGDAARLAHYYFTRDSEHEPVAFTVDKPYLNGESFGGLPLVAFEDVAKLYPSDEYAMFVAIGYSRMNKNRAEKFYRAKELGYKLVSYVSSRCACLTDNPVGENCFILENTTIQPFVRIGHNVALWSGSQIMHDSVIEDHCFLASHVVVLGRVRIHPYCFIGANATLRDSITIAPRTLIGAGAVIMKDTVEGGVYLPRRAELFDKDSDEIKL